MVSLCETRTVLFENLAFRIAQHPDSMMTLQHQVILRCKRVSLCCLKSLWLFIILSLPHFFDGRLKGSNFQCSRESN
jgi:hypothetical protein